MPALLLPLAGPEELSESDNDKLPVDLQYLEEDKKRETDPEIRVMLIECLMMVKACLYLQFSAVISSAIFSRSKGQRALRLRKQVKNKCITIK